MRKPYSSGIANGRSGLFGVGNRIQHPIPSCWHPFDWLTMGQRQTPWSSSVGVASRARLAPGDFLITAGFCPLKILKLRMICGEKGSTFVAWLVSSFGRVKHAFGFRKSDLLAQHITMSRNFNSAWIDPTTPTLRASWAWSFGIAAFVTSLKSRGRTLSRQCRLFFFHRSNPQVTGLDLGRFHSVLKLLWQLKSTSISHCGWTVVIDGFLSVRYHPKYNKNIQKLEEATTMNLIS